MSSQPGRVVALAERAGDRLAGSIWALFTAFTLVFLPATLYWSSRRPLWSDEIYTAYIAGLPSVSDIWNALAQGADLQPPMIFLTTRLSVSLFGHHEWAIRLPGTLGFLLMAFCLIWFVARRTNGLWGLVAAFFVLLCSAYRYSAEARPYGLMLGFAGLALVCWQVSTVARPRKLALTGLTLSLALALFTHYYAFLLFFPIAIGEAARTWVWKRVDWGVWLAMAFSAPVLLIVYPLVKQSVGGMVGSKVSYLSAGSLLEAYRDQLDTGGAILVILAALTIGAMRAAAGSPVIQWLKLDVHEAAVVIGLLAVPIPAFAMAALVTHRLVAHYMIILVLGAAALFTYAVHRLVGGSSGVALILALLMAGLFGGRALALARANSLNDAEPVKLDRRYPELPIVVSSGLAFVQAWYYASPELRDRIIFVSDPQMALRYLRNEQTNSSIPYDARFFHWRTDTWEHFRNAQPRFLLNWTNEDSWLLPVLHDAGAQLDLLEIQSDGYLFLVTQRPLPQH